MIVHGDAMRGGKLQGGGGGTTGEFRHVGGGAGEVADKREKTRGKT